MTIDFASVRVLELGSHPGVSFCGMLLAGLGAQVTRLGPQDYERTGTQAAPITSPEGRRVSPTALYLDRDKDVATGRAVDDADFALADWMITSNEVDLQRAARIPGARPAVLGLLTHGDGAGSGSVMAEENAEVHAMALGGLLHMVGDRHREPVRLGGLQASYSGGLALLTGLMVATFGDAGGNRPIVVRASSVRAVRYEDWKTQIHFEGDGTRLERGSSTGPFVLRCRDGFVGFYYRTEEWLAVKQLFDDPRLDSERFTTQPDRDANRAELLSILTEHTRQVTKQQLYEQAQELAIPAGAVRTMLELVDDPQYRARDFIRREVVPGVGEVCTPRLPWTVDGVRAGTEAPARHVSEPTAAADGQAHPVSGQDGDRAPLAGVRVVDLSGITAGGRTTQLLADFGADVIKVEAGVRPDPFRHWSGVTGVVGEGDLDSPPFRAANRNKRGVAIDLKTAEGRELLGKLVRRADLVVENFRRGVMQRLGLSFEDLKRWNRRVALLSITSQGESGPESENKSFGGTLEALGGLMSVTGYDSSSPIWSTSKVNYPDQAVALLAPGIALWAVNEARRSGRALHVDLAQRELVTALLGGELAAASVTSQDPVPMGNATSTGNIQCLRCAGEDEWIVLTLGTAQDVLSMRELTGASSDATAVPSPVGDISEPELVALRQWCAEQTREAAVNRMRGVGLVASPVLRAWEVAEYRTCHVEVPTRDDIGSELQVSWPFAIDGTDGRVHARAPHLGEHTREVLREFGVERDVIDDLLERGVLAEPGPALAR